MCLGTRSSTLSITLSSPLNESHPETVPQVSLKQQLITYYLRTLNTESEAREHANLSAFLLDTAKDLLDCVTNSLIAPPPDVLSHTSSGTTTTGSSDEELTRRRCEEVKCNQLWDDQVWAGPHIFIKMDWNKSFGSTNFDMYLFVHTLK